MSEGIHAALVGLIKDLPKPGDKFPLDDKRRFIAAFGQVLDVIYPDEFDRSQYQIGGYTIHQGDQNPCEFPEKLWLFNKSGEGMEVRTENLENILDQFFKNNF